MALLIDTHVLVWAAMEEHRLPSVVREAFVAPGAVLCISAATAWEYADLHQRGRLPAAASFNGVAELLAVTLLDLPSDIWGLAAALPNLHRDPVDRMLIAHAIHADLTLVTADDTMRRYPVRTLW